MSAERILAYAVITISTVGAVVRFALFEFEEVLLVWRKVSAVYASRQSSGPRSPN